MTSSAAIVTRSLSIGYPLGKSGKKVVHASLDLELRSGEVTCLLGLNGAGKSTLIKTLCGFQKPLGGLVEVFGKPLPSYSQSKLSQTVGVVLTEHTNAGGVTVRELVSMGRYPHTGFFGTLKEHDREVVQESLEAVGIASKADCFVSEISDGERQKAFVAKALAQECPIIILDEPTAFLDVTSRLETMVTLRRLAHEKNKAVLLSTHDLDSALQTGDILWLMDPSAPMLCGTPDTLVADGSLERFFSTSSVRFDPVERRLTARNLS